MTPLHHACHHKCSKTNEQPNMQQGEISKYHTIASLLMLSQADIQAKDKMGNTPLHLAADEGCLEITKDLLDTAADARIHQVGSGRGQVGVRAMLFKAFLTLLHSELQKLYGVLAVLSATELT